jgi:hypothetical protein
MASGKKKRKAARQARKLKNPQTGPFPHPDGDRRHRGKYMTYEQVMAIKKMLHQGEAEAILREEE